MCVLVSVCKKRKLLTILRDNAYSSGYTKEDSIKVRFFQSVMLKENAAVTVYIGIRILDFAWREKKNQRTSTRKQTW